MTARRLTLAAIAFFAAAGDAVSDPNAASTQTIELRAYVPAVCEAALKSASLASDGLTATYALSARCNTPHTVEVSLAGTPGTRATISFDRTTRTAALFAENRFNFGRFKITPGARLEMIDLSYQRALSLLQRILRQYKQTQTFQP
jgi:hypothetical protein